MENVMSYNGITYKQSFYNFIFTAPDGRLLLYNTKTGIVSCINSSEERDMVLKILESSKADPENPIFKELLNAKYIVESSKNELEEIKQLHERYVNLDNIIHLTLLPTEACIFSCPYCFIYPKTNTYMSQDIYNGIYEYIEKRVEAKQNLTYVEISWFGGEPLLAKKDIISFMNRIKELEAKGTIKVRSTIVTNGYLLTPDTLLELLDSGIKTFQVTLDGDRHSHDQLRVMKDGSPTFDVIYKNLKDISETLDPLKEFGMSVRGNFLKSNLDSMESLLNKFKSEFSEDVRFNISFRPVKNFETAHDTNSNVAPDMCTKEESLNLQNELAFKTMGNIEHKKLLRMFNPLPIPSQKWCNVALMHSYIISPDGTLFACDSCVSNKDESIGRITPQGQIQLNENARRWKLSIFDEEGIDECLKCKLLPICFRACRRERLISNKNCCHWTEDYIMNSMKRYAEMIK